MATVELRGLLKRYGSTAVVDGIDLAVPDGAFVCVLGPSGCGKTTLLRLLAGFLEPDAGEIYVGDRRVSARGSIVPPHQRGMSMIFQSYALWPHMTVAENIGYGLRVRNLPSDEVDARVEKICAVVRVDELRARYPGELSGGQQQRVALARALVVEPQTLLLDEPLSNLDANLREEMRLEIRQLHETYRYTTIYVTHDQGEAMAIADLIVVLSGGKVEQVGTPEAIYAEPSSEFVARFVGGTNILRWQIEGSAVSGPVSIRYGDVKLLTARPVQQTNVVEGKVVRRVFLGNSRDYIVEAAGEPIRVSAPPTLEVRTGERVWLYFPPESCRILAAGEALSSERSSDEAS